MRRFFVGVVFAMNAFLADITISTTMFLSTIGGLVGAIALLFKLLIASKDKAIADALEYQKSCKETAADAVRMAYEIANRNRDANGLGPVSMSAPAATADLATLREAMVKINTAAGIEPPRKEPKE